MKPAAVLGISILLITITASVSAGPVEYRKGYVDGRFGQVHYHRAYPRNENVSAQKTPIVFLHQNPKSAVEYEHLLRELGKDRVALAFDTPGYGESDGPPAPPVMQDFAGSIADALSALGYGKNGIGRVDVFGFHTGAYIAAELSLIRPDLVRRIVLSGVAFRSKEERSRLLNELPKNYVLPEDGSKIVNRWYRIVIYRADGVSLERAAKIFLEDIHSLDKWWYAYNAVWSYPVGDKLPKLNHPVMIIQPHEMLLEETRRVYKELLPRAYYVEIPEIVDDVFDTGWRQYSTELRSWLDRPVSNN